MAIDKLSIVCTIRINQRLANDRNKEVCLILLLVANR